MRVGKAILCILLALLLPVCALADCAVNGNTGAALIASDGTELVPVGMYRQIKPLKDGYWCAIDINGKRALLDGAGTPLTEALYDEITCEKGTLLYREGKSWGILSDDGTPLVSARYSDIRVNGEGDYIALRNAVGTGSAQNVDFLDADGNETAIGVRVMYGLNDYSQGFMPVLFAKTGRYGYLDAQGVVAFEGQFSAAGPFQDGYAVVTTDEGTGMITRTGRMAVPAVYADILRIGDIALLSESDGGVLVLRIGGEELLHVDGEAYIGEVGAYGVIWTGEEQLLIDRTGAIAGRFAASATIAGGGAERIIVTDGAWGEACTYLAQPDGTIIGQKHQMILPLDETGTYYAVGCFDAEPVTNARGETVRSVWSAEDMRFALMNADGEPVSDFIYTMLRPADDGYFFAATADWCGLMDATGNAVWTAPEGF